MHLRVCFKFKTPPILSVSWNLNPSILILSSHFSRYIPSSPFLSCFPNNNFYVHIISHLPCVLKCSFQNLLSLNSKYLADQFRSTQFWTYIATENGIIKSAHLVQCRGVCQLLCTICLLQFPIRFASSRFSLQQSTQSIIRLRPNDPLSNNNEETFYL